jgi:uncharacterized protein
MSDASSGINRRDFLHRAAGAAMGASALGTSSNEGAFGKTGGKPDPDKLVWRNKRPEMVYRRLGRTNWMVSRLAAGWRGNNRLKRMLFNKGVNYFDTSRAYANGNNEKELSELVGKIRDKIFLTSKASGMAGWPRRSFEPGEGKKAAQMYNKLLDTSLRVLKVEHLDCYYLHGVAEPWVLEVEELYDAFQKAHKAGKVKHNGFTTHVGVSKVLAKALEIEKQGQIRFDLIMAACNPNAWSGRKDVVEQLRACDVGVICMKSTGNVRAAESPKVDELMRLGDGLELNRTERSYAYMLHVADFDVLISEMQNVKQVEGNLKLPGIKLAGADWDRLRDKVAVEQRGACHHCGQCTLACPELIEVHDVLRYHSYYHNYGHREDACAQYRELGYDVALACSQCGRCNAVCPAGIDLQTMIGETARKLA